MLSHLMWTPCSQLSHDIALWLLMTYLPHIPHGYCIGPGFGWISFASFKVRSTNVLNNLIVTYAVKIICLSWKSHHKLLSTDESKVTFYVDSMSWSHITPSLCLHIQKLELTIDKTGNTQSIAPGPDVWPRDKVKQGRKSFREAEYDIVYQDETWKTKITLQIICGFRMMGLIITVIFQREDNLSFSLITPAYWVRFIWNLSQIIISEHLLQHWHLFT
jgi:hypothetical protein